MCLHKIVVKKENSAKKVLIRRKSGKIKKSPNLELVESPIDQIGKDHLYNFDRNYLGTVSIHNWE